MSIRNVLRIEKKKRVSADTNITDAYKVPYGQSNVGSALDGKVGEWVYIDEVSKTGTTGQYEIKVVTADITRYKEFLIQVVDTNNIVQASVNGFSTQSQFMVWETRATSASVSNCYSGKFILSSKELSVALRYTSGTTDTRKVVLYGR